MADKAETLIVRISEEESATLALLERVLGQSRSDVVRGLIWPMPVAALFVQACDFESVDIQTVILRTVGVYARELYVQNVDLHLKRFGLPKGVNSTAPEIEAAKSAALAELKADTAHPLGLQLARAERDPIFMGRLIEAHRKAKTLEPNYQLCKVELAFGKRVRKVWAVLKDGKVL